MKIKDKNYILVASILLLACFFSSSLYFKAHTAKDTVDIFRFPTTLDNWTSTNLPITDDEYAILETRNAFVRQYTHPDGREVFLFIVYSQDNRKVSHPPEVCYTGSGVSVLGKTVNMISMPGASHPMPVNELRLQKGNLNEIAFYWFKVGDSFTSSYWKQQILIALKTLLGRPASSAMIRISADITQKGEEATKELLKEFSARIIPELKQYLP